MSVTMTKGMRMNVLGRGNTLTAERTTATAVGLLILTATVSYLVGSVLIESAVKDTNYLMGLDSTKVRVGALLEFVDAVAVVGIGVLLFPILRKHHEGFALGYAGTRIIESVLLLVSVISPLMLIALSQDYVQADAVRASNLQSLGSFAMSLYDLAFQMAMIALGTGSLLLCYILYKVRLIPRWLSAVGAVGYVALFASGWLEIFGYDTGNVLFVPGAIFELIFPIWLIAKGFNGPAVTA